VCDLTCEPSIQEPVFTTPVHQAKSVHQSFTKLLMLLQNETNLLMMSDGDEANQVKIYIKTYGLTDYYLNDCKLQVHHVFLTSTWR
jgi:hypothetical protein